MASCLQNHLGKLSSEGAPVATSPALSPLPHPPQPPRCSPYLAALGLALGPLFSAPLVTWDTHQQPPIPCPPGYFVWLLRILIPPPDPLQLCLSRTCCENLLWGEPERECPLASDSGVGGWATPGISQCRERSSWGPQPTDTTDQLPPPFSKFKGTHSKARCPS